MIDTLPNMILTMPKRVEWRIELEPRVALEWQQVGGTDVKPLCILREFVNGEWRDVRYRNAAGVIEDFRALVVTK